MKRRVSKGPLGIAASQQVWMIVSTGKEGKEVEGMQEALNNEVSMQECNLAEGGLVYCVVEGASC